RLPVDDARMGGRHEVVRTAPGGEAPEEVADRIREMLEAERVVDDVLRGADREGLIVRKEQALAAEVALGAVVVPSDDRVVGPLEEPQLAVVNEFDGGFDHPGGKAGNLVPRSDGRGGD